MVRHTFDRRIDTVVVSPQHGRARQKPHMGHLRQLRHGLRRPVGPGLRADGVGFGVQPPAHAEILIRQDHPRPAAPGGQGGGQARRPRPDDQQVAMQKALVIGIRVILHRQRPQAGGAADQRLIDLFPERGRPHEGLVIEARRKEGRQAVIDRQRVEFQRRPAVLALRLQPVEQLHRGRPRVGLAPRPAAQLHQGIRLFRPGGNRPARTVILEAAPHQPHAIGQKRRGQRIAGMSQIGQPVEGEADRAAAVDLAARDAIVLCHRPRPRSRATSRAISTCVISCVRVLRVTTSQDRSPCS